MPTLKVWRLTLPKPYCALQVGVTMHVRGVPAGSATNCSDPLVDLKL
jgi:hypothetical protein